MFNLYFQLAIRDLWHDKKVSLCTIFALVAIMAPLLLLFGLKQGVVNELQHELQQKPDLLEIKTNGNNHRLSQEWIATVSERPDVSFVEGLTRSLNTEAQVFKTERAAKHNFQDNFYSEIIPTKIGDPVLKDQAALIDENHIAISYYLAEKLNAKVGDPIFFRLARVVNGVKEFSYIDATISYVLPPHGYPRAAAFVPIGVLLGIELFIDKINNEYEFIHSIPTAYSFANVRIYARHINDVLSLTQWLESQHINSTSQQAAIHSTLTISSVLNFIFMVIAGTALLGGLISLVGSFLSSIERKRPHIAVLQLIGLSPRQIIYYISIQIVIIISFAYFISLLFYLVGSSAFNQVLNTNQSLSSFSTYLSINQIFFAFLISCFISTLVALLGAKHVMKIEPAESLREI